VLALGQELAVEQALGILGAVVQGLGKPEAVAAEVEIVVSVVVGYKLSIALGRFVGAVGEPLVAAAVVVVGGVLGQPQRVQGEQPE